MSGSAFIRRRIVQVGNHQTSEEEVQLVLPLLEVLSGSYVPGGLAELAHYQQALATSAWPPSLGVVVGFHYHETGRYTLAMKHWELTEAAQDFAHVTEVKAGLS
jgi:hypothetical protein